MLNLSRFKQDSLRNRHRAVIIISGTWDICLEQLRQQINKTVNTWWLSDTTVEPPLGLWQTDKLQCIPPTQAKHYLGRQCQQLVINAHHGLDLNAVGALSGGLIAGGCCFILTPPLSQWPQLADRQNQRFHTASTVVTNEVTRLDKPQTNYLVTHLIQCFQAMANVVRLGTSHYIPQLTVQPVAAYQHQIYRSAEQQHAVEKIIKVATGHRHRPLVLTADRGRGKSSALGLAASQLIQAGKTHILVTAPQKASTDSLFQRLDEQLCVTLNTPEHCRFVAIDSLLANQPPASLLLVDEAAAFAAPLLIKLLKHYARIVFTSTIHGYEGTGRSFELRFKNQLAQLKPQWRQFHLTTAIRYAESDPLEKLTNQMLMWNAEAAVFPASFTDIDQQLIGQFTHWRRDQLIKHQDIFKQIVGTLVQAHYKTDPNHIRHLLNGNNIDIYTLTQPQGVLAVAMIAREGGFDQTMTSEINQGKRRPRGHLLPQSLVTHCGILSATNYRFARVVRIATHPQLRRHHLGSQLLQHIEAHYAQHNFDFIGASFGCNRDLLPFWFNNHYTAVRLGLTIETSSNEYSALVLKALDQSGQALVNDTNQRFTQQLNHQLIEFNPLLCPFVAIMLLSGKHAPLPLNQQQLQDIHYYVTFNRGYEYCSSSLHAWLLWHIHHHQASFLQLKPTDAGLLIDKLIRHKSWAHTVTTFNLTGEKVAQQRLKQLISELNAYNASPDG